MACTFCSLTSCLLLPTYVSIKQNIAELSIV